MIGKAKIQTPPSTGTGLCIPNYSFFLLLNSKDWGCGVISYSNAYHGKQTRPSDKHSEEMSNTLPDDSKSSQAPTHREH